MSKVVKTGLMYLVAAPVSSEPANQAIVYGDGFEVCPLIQRTYTENRRDNKLRGNNINQFRDQGLTDYSYTLEGTGIDLATKAKLFGYKTVTTGTQTSYQVTGANTPYYGLGCIMTGQDDSRNVYVEAEWAYKVQLTPADDTANTEQENIEWQTAKVNVKGDLVYIDNSGSAVAKEMASFTTVAAAKTWLNAKAGIT